MSWYNTAVNKGAGATLDKSPGVAPSDRTTQMQDKSTPPDSLKTCSRCGEEKPLRGFHRRSDQDDGHHTICKSCAIKASRAWYEQNRERAKEADRVYRAANQDRRNAASRAYYRANAERLIADQRARDQALKDAAYAAYGGYRCCCCGESEPLFLCLDHVDGRGNEHRREIGGATNLYQWLKRNDYPEGLLQVLCFNCNQGKRLNGNVCPHQTKNGPLVKALYDIDIVEV